MDKNLADAVAGAVLEKVKQFTVGFAIAGDDPAVKGSGVLIKYEGIAGILTCAHVIKSLDKINRPVGLVRFRRNSSEQYGVLDLNQVPKYGAGEEPWEKSEFDLAFIQLPAHLVGSIGRDAVFLNGERNFEKPEPDGTTQLMLVHSAFGLVEEFTGETVRSNGRATTRLRGVLTSGIVSAPNERDFKLECFAENVPDLPDSFGGTSGGGVWRCFLRKSEGDTVEVVHHRLIGIASQQDLTTSPPKIVSQGMPRIRAMMVMASRAARGEEVDDPMPS